MTGAGGETVIRLEGVETRFGPQRVHAGIDLEVRRGEIFALVGGSGSGKTTLLRVMLLLHRPSAGRVVLLGRDAARTPERELLALRRRMGVLFQHDALFSGLSLLENVMVPLREHTRLPEALARELALLRLALVGLGPETGPRLPEALSGGMRKRGALARALALDPELLFLDEPTAGLDPDAAGAFDELVLRLRDALGLTVVLVTHDLDTLMRIADRIALLAEGRIAALGTREEVLASGHPAARRFFHGPRGAAARERAWSRA